MRSLIPVLQTFTMTQRTITGFLSPPAGHCVEPSLTTPTPGQVDRNKRDSNNLLRRVNIKPNKARRGEKKRQRRMNSGWKGRVIDTFRSLYRKTHFRVIRNGKSSPPLLNNIGFNQGGVASGLMFRKYMSALCDYLSKEFGIVISDIIAHILWGDDLILFSDTVEGLQRQLIGFQKFCSHNKIIVNETKNEVYVFWYR